MTTEARSRGRGASRTAVVDGQDLDVLIVVTTVDVLVLDPQIGEMHVPVEVGQIVFARPIFDLLFIAIRPAVSIRATAIALVQPLLVLALEFVVEHDAFDVRAALLKKFRFAQVRALDLGVVLPLTWLFELGVELLALAAVALYPYRCEQ